MRINEERILELVAAALVIGLIGIMCAIASLVLPNVLAEVTPTPLLIVANPATEEPTPTPVYTRTPTPIPSETPTPAPVPTPTIVFDSVETTVQDEGPFQIARVEAVIDGDTIEVVMNGRNYVVHYLLIDAPELLHPISGEPDPFGTLAFELNRQLVGGKLVRLEKDKADRDDNGDLLRYVFLSGTDFMVNRELVKRGLAQVILDVQIDPATPVNRKYQDTLMSAAFSAQTGLAGALRPTVTPTRRPEPTVRQGSSGSSGSSSSSGSAGIVSGDSYDCSSDQYNCRLEDFATQAEAQAYFLKCMPGDIHGLDADDDGDARENLP